MTSARPPHPGRWRALLVAVLAALAGLLLPPALASANGVPAAQTRVGASGPATAVAVGVHECITAGQRPVRGPSRLQVVVGHCVAAEAEGGGVLANQAAGNAARDAIVAANPGSLIEQTFQTTLGARRLDVLTQEGIGIESKVGYTSLTRSVQSQIAKDQALLDNGDLSGVQWIFSRSGVTGRVGPSGPLADALGKAGIPWWIAP
jgi:hypothetical protein